MEDPTKWPAQELFWVGLAFEQNEPEPIEDYSARTRLVGAFISTNSHPCTHSTLSDGTRVTQVLHPTFGPVYRFSNAQGRAFGFGIRTADERGSRALLGKANRILGFACVDREAGIWAKTIFATPQQQ